MLTFTVRDAWWILGLPALVLVAVLAVGEMGADRYTAEAKLVVAPAVSGGSTDQLLRATDALNDEVLVNTLADMLKTQAVRVRAREAAGIPPSSDIDLTTTKIPASNIVQVIVTGPTAEETAAFANAATEAGAEQFEHLYPPFTVEVLSRAAPEDSSAQGASLFERLFAGAIAGGALLLPVGWLVDRRRQRRQSAVSLRLSDFYSKREKAV